MTRLDTLNRNLCLKLLLQCKYSIVFLTFFEIAHSLCDVYIHRVLVPIHWLLLIGIAWIVFGSTYAYLLAISLPILLYSHIRVLEESRSIMQNVWFLINIATRQERVKGLGAQRKVLASKVRVSDFQLS